MADILKKLGIRIREERKKKKLTQEKLAEMVDLSTDYIGYIERGKQAPYLKTLERIAESLDVEVYELFMFEDTVRRSDRKVAISELIMLLQDKSPDDIKFTASILRQVFERVKEKEQRISNFR